jgi:hypothetical protein
MWVMLGFSVPITPFPRHMKSRPVVQWLRPRLYSLLRYRRSARKEDFEGWFMNGVGLRQLEFVFSGVYSYVRTVINLGGVYETP